MARTKTVMKRIEKKSRLQVSFYKRRKGLFKKAEELSTLCGADIGIVVFSNSGRLHEFSSSKSLTGTLERYVQAKKEVSEGVQDREHSKCSTAGELLKTIERQLGEANVHSLSPTELVNLESRLETALIRIKSRKTQLMLEPVQYLQQKEKVLMEENQKLKDELEMARMKMSGQQRVTLNLLV